MNSTKAYAALSATTDVIPYTIERRNPKPHDVQIENFIAEYVTAIFILPVTTGA